MSQLRDGALDGLSEQQKARKLAAHEKVSQGFQDAAAGRTSEIPTAKREVVMKTMHLVPTPYGTQTQILNTPTGQKKENSLRRLAEREAMKGMTRADKAKQIVDLKKEFNNTRELRRIRKQDNKQSRPR